jgi:uncharacterized protein (UPF0335 family)
MTRKPTHAIPAAGHNSLDRDRLYDIISRIESIEQERAELANDVKDILAEAKSSGLDVKAIRAVLRRRRQDPDEVAALQSTVDEYMSALGMLADLPLGKAALERAAASLRPPA